MVNNINEITGYKAIGQRAMVRFIKNKKSPIISPSSNVKNVVRWIFKIKSPAASVSIYKNGTVQIATKAPIERVVSFLDQHYFPGFAEAQVEPVNFSGRFFINYRFFLPFFRLKELGGLGKHFEFLASHIDSYVTVRYKDIDYKLFAKGQVLFQAADPKNASKYFFELFEKYKPPLTTAITNSGDSLTLGEYGSPQRAKVNKKQKMANKRYPIAPAGYGIPLEQEPGYYVRPGSNGKPRLYPIPKTNKEKAAIRMKVLRAYTNAGVPIPMEVAGLFNLVGVKLKEKVEKNNAPASFNAVKPGFYVKPGKGGLPQFYRMPEHINKARPGVIEAYRRAGKNIPQTVKNQFKIGNVGPQLPAGHHINKVGNRYRINGAFADTYTDAQLLAIARNLKIPQASSALKKGNVIQLIVRKLGGSPNGSPHATINGVPHTLLMNGRVMRGKRAKQWKLLTAAEKNAIGRKILTSNANYKEWKETITRDQQYEALLAHVHAKKKTPTPPPPPPPPAPKPVPVPVPAPPSPSPNNMNNLINLEFYLSNAFGNKYENLLRNGNAANLKKLLNALPKAKRGKPLQANVNRTKIAFVKALKYSRQLENIKKKYYAKIVVPANMRAILRNNVNEYKRVLTNIATTLNSKGEFPKQADVKKAIITWVRYKYPRRVKGVPREVENMITGQKRMVYPSPPSPNRKTPNVPRLSAKRLSPLKVERREPAYKRPRKQKKKKSANNSSTNSNSNSAPRPVKKPAVGPVKQPPAKYYFNRSASSNRLTP